MENLDELALFQSKYGDKCGFVRDVPLDHSVRLLSNINTLYTTHSRKSRTLNCHSKRKSREGEILRMYVYLFVNIVLVLVGILYIKPKQGIAATQKRCSEKMAIFVSFVILFVVSAFRGSFTSDYKNYITLFNFVNSFSLDEIFRYSFQQEIGYIVLNRIIGLFTTDGLYLMIVTSFLILILFFTEFVRESVNLWFTILMFVTMGSYYTSFNITRQIIAAAIVFTSSRYLYQRDFVKYFFCILIAALFHKTAFVMMIFYSILNLKFNFRRAFLLCLSFILFFSFGDVVFDFARSLTSYSYYTPGAYGTFGFRYTNAVVPVAVFCFTLLHSRSLDMNNTRERVMFNAVLFYAFFSLLGMRVMLLQRLSEFFAPYSFLIVPKIVGLYKNPYERVLFFMAAILLLISYNYVSLNGTGYMNYYFIWQSWGL